MTLAFLLSQPNVTSILTFTKQTANIEWRGEDHTFRIFCPQECGEIVRDFFFEVVQALIYEEVVEVWENEDETASESGPQNLVVSFNPQLFLPAVKHLLQNGCCFSIWLFAIPWPA